MSSYSMIGSTIQRCIQNFTCTILHSLFLLHVKLFIAWLISMILLSFCIFTISNLIQFLSLCFLYNFLYFQILKSLHSCTLDNVGGKLQITTYIIIIKYTYSKECITNHDNLDKFFPHISRASSQKVLIISQVWVETYETLVITIQPKNVSKLIDGKKISILDYEIHNPSFLRKTTTNMPLIFDGILKILTKTWYNILSSSKREVLIDVMIQVQPKLQQTTI